MLSQFFNHYLLESGLVTREQLLEALSHKADTRVKLGVLAINAGFMSAEQVETIHRRQEKVDKRIGDIAVELGFLTTKQINELLSAQRPAHLILGQALVDEGVLTNAQFESAWNQFRAKYVLDDGDFTDEKDDKLAMVLSSYLKAKNTKEAAFPVDYILLLLKSLTRFITDDYTPLSEVPCMGTDAVYITQAIKGDLTAVSRIVCSPTTLTALASLFAKTLYTDVDITESEEYTEASVSEFLNLHNGLFAVNMSTARSIELALEPQELTRGGDCACKDNCVVLPICFSFGEVTFMLEV